MLVFWSCSDVESPSKGHLKVCVTSAGRVMLAEARRTLAGESTDGVDAGELAVVSSALTFIHIYKSNHCFHSVRAAEHLKDILTV